MWPFGPAVEILHRHLDTIFDELKGWHTTLRELWGVSAVLFVLLFVFASLYDGPSLITRAWLVIHIQIRFAFCAFIFSPVSQSRWRLPQICHPRRLRNWLATAYMQREAVDFIVGAANFMKRVPREMWGGIFLFTLVLEPVLLQVVQPETSIGILLLTVTGAFSQPVSQLVWMILSTFEAIVLAMPRAFYPAFCSASPDSAWGWFVPMLLALLLEPSSLFRMRLKQRYANWRRQQSLAASTAPPQWLRRGAKVEYRSRYGTSENAWLPATVTAVHGDRCTIELSGQERTVSTYRLVPRSQPMAGGSSSAANATQAARRRSSRSPPRREFASVNENLNDPARYKPATQRETILHVNEKVGILDDSAKFRPATAKLDTGNGGSTMMTVRCAMALGLVDVHGIPTDYHAVKQAGIRQTERAEGVVAGAWEKNPLIYLRYKLKGKEMAVQAAISKQTFPFDLLISLKDIREFEHSGFRLSTT